MPMRRCGFVRLEGRRGGDGCDEQPSSGLYLLDMAFRAGAQRAMSAASKLAMVLTQKQSPD